MKSSFLLKMIVVYSGLFFMSCNIQQGSNNSQTSDTLLAKTITFPRSLSKFRGSQLQPIDSFLLDIDGKRKVISIIDGTCMKCIIYQLNRIDSIFNATLPEDDDIVLIFVLNVFKEDSVFFMRNLYPEIRALGILLWDNDYNFERENQMFTPDEYLRTFLTDHNNRIVQYGNPIMNPDIIAEYRKKLLKNGT